MLVDFHSIGGDGGNWKELVGGYNGATLQWIKVWVGGWQIRGIKARLTNGQEAMFGSEDGPMREYTFSPAERITRLSLWGNGAGSRAGWIEFDTSTGGRFSHGMNSWGRKTEYKMDVGSGICVGLFGTSGSDVDSVGFAFIKPLRKAKLIDVVFPTTSLDQVVFPPKTLVSRKLNNGSEVVQEQGVRISYTETTRDSFTFESALEISLEVGRETGVEFSIPELGKISGKQTVKFGTKLTTKFSKTKEVSHSETLEYTFPVKIPANSSMEVDAWIYSNEFDLDYTGKIHLETTTGETADIPVSGRYNGVITSQVYTNFRQVPYTEDAASRSVQGRASSDSDEDFDTSELPAEDLTKELVYPGLTADEALAGRSEPLALGAS